MNVSKQNYVLNLVSWLVSVNDNIMSNFAYIGNIFSHFFMKLEIFEKAASFQGTLAYLSKEIRLD